MSKLRTSNRKNRGSAWERIWDSLTGTAGHRRVSSDRKPRRLMIDQLEERQLLSVSPVNVNDMLINQGNVTAPLGETFWLNSALVSGKAVATNNNGDFVVAWQGVDYVGINDPDTGLPMTDSNIYARYFTNAAQRIDLPPGLLPTSQTPGQSMILQYNGNAVQKLTVSGGAKPFNGPENVIGTFRLDYTSPINSTTYLMDRDPATGVKITFDETKPTDNAASIQAALQSIYDRANVAEKPNLEALNGVTVQAIDAQNYQVVFGDGSAGWAQNYLSMADQNFTAGFLPAVDVSIVRNSGQTMPIPVSSNPATTAANIAYAFSNATSQDYLIGPIAFPRPSDVSPAGSVVGPYQYPDVLRVGAPTVTVTARSATQFDVAFTGDSGKMQQPLLVVLDSSRNLVTDAAVSIIKQSSDTFRVNAPEPNDPDTIRRDFYDQKNPQVAMDTDGDFVITWEGTVPDSQNLGSVSDIFARRFSPAGFVSDPYRDIIFSPNGSTALSGHYFLTTGKGDTTALVFDSTDLAATATAAQDALHTLGYDAATTVTVTPVGTTYVLRVTWGGVDAGTESAIEYQAVLDPVTHLPEVSATVTTSSLVPFLADMNHSGVVDTPIQGIRPLGSEFQVNTFTTNAQTEATVGVDGDGNFTIAWQSEAQGLSYFNSIDAQRYDRDGNPLGGQFRVNSTENTNINFAPYVAMSDDGVLAIAWNETSDEQNFLHDLNNGTATGWFKIYDGNGVQLVDQQSFGGWIPTFCFDAADNFVVTWLVTDGGDNNGVNNNNVYANQYQLYTPGTKTLNFMQTQSQFRLNSATLDLTVNNLWPYNQNLAQAVMDADGDLTAVYFGYGPDVSEDVDMLQLLNVLTSASLPYRARLIAAGLTEYFLPYTNPTTLQTRTAADYFTYYGNTGDVDGAIASVLLYAKNAQTINGNVTAPISDTQLGAFRSILNDAVGLLRGEANGALFSQFDAALNGRTTVITSDDVANSKRDGSNTTWLLTLDPAATSGGFSIRVLNYGPDLNFPGFVDVAVAPVYYPNNGPLNPYDTLKVIHDAIQSAVSQLGLNWPQNPDGSGFEGPVSVRLLDPPTRNTSDPRVWDPQGEVFDRIGTDWDVTKGGLDPSMTYYEITFLGEVHDVRVDIHTTPASFTMKKDIPAVSEIQTIDITIPQTTLDGGVPDTTTGSNLTKDVSDTSVQTQLSNPMTNTVAQTTLNGALTNTVSQTTLASDVTDTTAPVQTTLATGVTDAVGPAQTRLDQELTDTTVQTALRRTLTNTVVQTSLSNAIDATVQTTLNSDVDATAPIQTALSGDLSSAIVETTLRGGLGNTVAQTSLSSVMSASATTQLSSGMDATAPTQTALSGDLSSAIVETTLNGVLGNTVAQTSLSSTMSASTTTQLASPVDATAPKGTTLGADLTATPAAKITLQDAITNTTAPGTAQLTSAITASQTTITVKNATGMPSTPFDVVVDKEVMKVTNVVGTTWTVTRALYSSTAASHSLDAAITSAMIITVKDATGLPPSPSYIQVDNEIMRVYSKAVISGSDFLQWCVTRAQLGTAPAQHTNTTTPSILAQSTITVASTAGFPAYPFSVAVDDEMMLVVGVDSAAPTTTFLAFRGQQGTTVAAHSRSTATFATTSTITVSSNAGFPSGASSISVDGEIMRVLAKSGAGNTVWTVSRAQLGSSSTAHGVNANVVAASTMSVTNASPFSAMPAPFYVMVGNEIMLVTAKTGTNWTVFGAQKGTSVASHNADTAIFAESRMTVDSAAGFPAAPFSIAVDGEIIKVIDASTVNWRVFRAQNGTPLAAHDDGLSVVASSTMTVASAAAFPATPFYVAVDDEIMWVGAMSGTDSTEWTVYRAQRGAEAASHDHLLAKVSTLSTINVDNAGVFPDAPFSIIVGDEIMRVLEKSGAGDTQWAVVRAQQGSPLGAHTPGTNVISATTLQVNDPAPFSDPAPFFVAVDGEVMKVVATSGDTWTAFGAQQGTTAAGHAVDASVVASSTITVNSSSGFPGVPFEVAIDGEILLVGAVNATTNEWTVYRAQNETPLAVHDDGSSVVASSTMTVASAAAFPATPFYVAVGDEIMWVVAMSGTDNTEWTVYRAQRGAEAASHDHLLAKVSTLSTISVADAKDFPDVPFSIMVGDEVMRVLEKSGADGSQWTVVRSQYGTTPVVHTAGAGVISATTLTVVNPAPFSGMSAPFTVAVGGEIMKVVAKSGNTWTAFGSQQGTLAADHGAGASVVASSTITVNSSSGFPAVPFEVAIGDEIMLVSAVNATTNEWTVYRAQKGTTAAAHAPLDIVTTMSTLSVLDTTTGFPAAPFYILVDTEVLRVLYTSGTDWTVVRGQLNTTAANHLLGANVLAVSTITVDNPIDFPTTPFFVAVENELMQVIAKSGNLWTVIRAQQGTAPSTHPASAIVSTTSTITVTSAKGFPAVPFSIMVDGEMMRVMAMSGPNNTQWTVVRAWQGTPEVAHTAATATIIAETTITVADATSFATMSLPFYVAVDGEIMLVSTMSGAGSRQWTVFRAQLGTVLAVHNNLASIVGESTINVSDATGFPATPFYVAVDDEIVLVGAMSGVDPANPTEWKVFRSQFGTAQTTHAALATVATTTTISVADASGFPAAPFYVAVDGEIMRVLAKSGNDLIVVRGQRGTAAIAHTHGANVVVASIITVADGTSFPAVPPGAPFYVMVDSEIMLVMSMSGPNNTQWEVYRAQKNTAIDDHASGASVLAVTTTTTTLPSGITDTAATDIQVADSTGFPPTPFFIKVDDELMLVTAVDPATNLWTVTRGQSGTAAAIHMASAEVKLIDFTILDDAGNPLPIAALDLTIFTNPDGYAITLRDGLVASGFAGVRVVYESGLSDPAAGHFVYTVYFEGDSAGVDQNEIIYVPGIPQVAIADISTVRDGIEEITGADAAGVGYAPETMYDLGTSQHNASIAMTSSGSFVTVWNEDARTTNGSFAATNLYFREFKESTDTVGPLVTDFLLPNANPNDTAESRLQNGNTVRQQINTVVVTFDCDMMTLGGTTGVNSVTNPNNWALMKDGVMVSGGISQIYYGMNEAATRLGMPAGNKWEAVVVLDGNYLTDGHYEIVATTSLRDKAGNALGRTGYTPNGYVFSRSFDVSLPTGMETLVNTTTTLGNQYTSPSDEIQRITLAPTGASPKFTVKIGDYTGGLINFNSANLAAMAAEIQFQLKTAGFLGAAVTSDTAASPYEFTVRFAGNDTGIDQPPISILTTNMTASVKELQKGTQAPPPQATASNGDGDYIVVWTSDTVGSQGVYARIYPATWTAASGARVLSAGNPKDVTVQLNTTAQYASVACDAVGNFIVTWSQNDGTSAAPDWNVWAKLFDKNGAALKDANGNDRPAFRVNATTVNAQQYSTVAADADGNFVIAWQSLNQDGSGWGIYGQSYDCFGNPVGGTNEVDILSFEGNPVGDFRLHWNGQDTGKITYNGRPDAIVGAVKSALENIGAHVNVVAVSATEISIEFIGVNGNQNVDLLTVTNPNYTAGDQGAIIYASTLVDGATGEFRVNDSTTNNQMYPSVAMNATGSFVVSWTGYGQDDDDSYQSNVYVKQYGDRSVSNQSGFNIDLQFGGELTPTEKWIFTLAAFRWESIITADIPDVQTDTAYYDDITIDASAAYIDGDGGILGQAGPNGVRNGSFLPYAGVMQFDTADLESMEINGELLDVITHEMAHVLGFGTIWTDLHLLTGAGGPDPKFNGARAVAEYNSAFALNVSSVPVENTGGGGTRDSHWRESVFDNELMTGWLNAGVNPLSRMTAASMADLGYQVDLNAATVVYLTSGSSEPSQTVGSLNLYNGPRSYANVIPTGSALQSGDETLVNVTTADDQKWSSVAIDDAGEFVVTWTSYGQDGAGNGPGAGVDGENGVYVRRFNHFGLASGSEFIASTFTNKDQQYSHVAMNSAGDFVVVWESYQDRSSFNGTDEPNTADSSNSYGIYAQKYARESLVGPPNYTGPNGEIETEIPVNTTKNGAQRYPSVAMDDNGDFLVVWSGNGERPGNVDTQGVFLQRFDRTTDTAGPQAVATFYDINDSLHKVHENDNISAPTVTRFIVVFSEDVNNELAGTPDWLHSVRNPSNWSISRDGVAIPGGIVVEGYDPSTHEVTLRLDADANEAGKQPLSPLEYSGTYVITASSAIEDVFGNALDGDMNSTPGGDFHRTFTISVMANISGTVYNDPKKDTVIDANGVITSGGADDLGLSNWTVWLDLADSDHPADGIADYTTTTAFDGSYTFTDVPAGTYLLYQELQPGWEENYPIHPIGVHEITIASVQPFTGKKFVNIDILEPILTVDALAPTNIKTPKLTGTVTDPGPGSGIADVKVQISNVDHPTVILYTMTWTPSPVDMVGGKDWLWFVKTADVVPAGLADGEYLLTVTAKDNAGNVTIDDSQTIIIDTRSPNGLTLATPTTRVTRPTLSGTVTDPVTSSGIASVMVSVGGRTPVAATVTFDRQTGTGTWTLPWPTAWLSLSIDVSDVKILATDVAGNPVYTLSGTLTFDQIAPQISSVGPVTPDPREASVDSIDVVFSEAINGSTFNVSDIALYCNNTAVNLGNAVTVSYFSGTTYRINGLSSFTNADAQYEIIVFGSGIQDLAGNAGTGAAFDVWIKDMNSPTIDFITSVSPDPRNTPVDSVNVTFSELIDTSTFDYHDLTLTRDNVDVSSTLSSIISISLASGTTYTISGLNTFTSDGGQYVLTVNGAGIKDRAGHAGSGSVSDTWQMDILSPVVSSITKTDLNPKTYAAQVSFIVTFTEPVLNVDAGDFILAPINITGASIVSVSPVSGPANTYTVTVNTGSGNGWLGLKVKDIDSIRDVSGNLLGGAGLDNGNFPVLANPPTQAELSRYYYEIDKTSPNKIDLSNASVVEKSPIGTVVGILSTSGSTSSPFTYTLVPGVGSDDNAQFQIVGNQLRTNAVFDVMLKKTYTICVRTTDSLGRSFDQPISISVVSLGHTATVGDRVWNDLNRNGVQDAGEPGVAGVGIEVYRTTNDPIGDADDVFVGRTTTATDGTYSISGLTIDNSEKYYLVYRAPAGYAFTTKDAGDDAKDSDANALGVTDILKTIDATSDAGLVAGSSAPGVGFALSAGGTGDDIAQSITTDALGNMYVTGSFQGTADFDPGASLFNLTSAGGRDVFVAKYLPSGSLVWAINLGGTGDDSSAGIAIGPDGNVYVTGGFAETAGFGSGVDKVTLTSAGGVDAFVAKLDPTGKMLWARAAGGTADDYANAIAVASDGSVSTTGYFQGTANFNQNGAGYNLTSVGPKDVFVTKLDTNGNLAWARSMGGIGWSQGISIGTGIDIDAGGNVYATGSFQGIADFNPGADQKLLTCAGETDVFVVKLDASGNYVWAGSMGGPNQDQGTGIAVAADGSIYTTGLFWGTADFDPSDATSHNLNSDGYYRTFVSKLKPNGDFDWAHSIGGTGTDRAAAIALGANDSSVFITGGFQGTAYFDATATNLVSAGDKDVFVTKFNVTDKSDTADPYDTICTYDWSLRMGGTKDDYGAGLALSGGDIYVTGYFQDTADFDPGAGTLNLVSAGGQDLFVAKLTTSYWDETVPSLPIPVIDNPSNTVATNTIGLRNPASSTFYLKNTNAAGNADSTFIYGPGNSNWVALAGDWDGDGIDTIGLYSPTSSKFYLRNSNSTGVADMTIAYGPAGAGWTPIVGDWDGDGIDTIGLYSTVSSKFFLRNSNASGVADVTFAYGPAGGGWTPLVGDWTNSGIDTIGLYSPTSSKFFLRNSNSTGVADTTFVYGPAGAGWTPLVGDWDMDGATTVGMFNPASAKFYLRNTNTQGAADVTFAYGTANAGWTPIVGTWTLPSPLMAADGVAATPSSSILTQEDLQPIVSEALARWETAGLDAATLAKLAKVQYSIGDLPGSYLGDAMADQIHLDSNAAGHGWFVDSTPTSDEEFAPSADGPSKAIDPRAVDRIDLLSVVEHELGHIAGFDDLDSLANGLMSADLQTGVRRNP